MKYDYVYEAEIELDRNIDRRRINPWSFLFV